MPEDVFVHLRDGRAERFRQIKAKLEERAGHDLGLTDARTMRFIARRTDRYGRTLNPRL